MVFSRLENLIGEKKLSLLSKKKVIVFGLGGVGSFAAEALVRSNIGQLIVVDYDKVDQSNINRQLIATRETVGEYKVDVFLRRAHAINPQVNIVALKEKVSYDNIEDYFEFSPDYVLDCIDDIDGKEALIKTCDLLHVPLILAMGFANKFHPEMIQVGLLKDTSVCPLARVMRKRVKMLGLSLDIPCVYSTEKPAKVLDNSFLGSTAFTPSVGGLIMASYVINQMIEEDKL